MSSSCKKREEGETKKQNKTNYSSLNVTNLTQNKQIQKLTNREQDKYNGNYAEAHRSEKPEDQGEAEQSSYA